MARGCSSTLPRRPPRGFTLLEVMVAIAILGLALTAILSAQAGAFSSSSRAQRLSVAVGLARCKMAELEEELRREGLPVLDASESGPCCDDEEGGFTCSWKIASPKLPEPRYGQLDLDTKLGENDPFGAFGSALSVDGGLSAEQGAAGLSEGISGLASMAMDTVYPDLKALLEASVRRVTVVVSWKEGSREESFDVAQWIAVPTQPPPPALDGGIE